MSSIVWSFFEKPELPVEHVPCPKCVQMLTYKGTTSGLKKHLKVKHFADYQRIMLEKGLVATSTSDFNYSELLLARAFCTGQVPYEFASNPEFRVFCQSLNSDFRVPSPQKIREILKLNTQTFIKENELQLRSAKNYVIITDGLAESKNAPPTFFSAHAAIVDQYTFERKVLLCGISYLHEVPETTAGKMAEIQKLAENVGLSIENLQSMVTDSNETLAGFKSIPCAGAAIADIFNKFTDHVKVAGRLHQDVKNVFKILEENEGSLDVAMAYQKEYNVSIPLPSKFKASKWGTLFTDMQAYLANSVYFPFMPCLINKPNQILSYQKHEDVMKLVALLQPLCNVLDALTQEDTFSSDIIPNLLCVKEELDVLDPHAVVLAELVRQKIASYLTNDQVLMALVSDPRYAYVPNLIDPRTWQEAEQLLIKQASDVPTASGASEILETPKTEEDGECRGLAGLLKRKIKSEVGQKNLTSELLHYQALMATNRPCHTSNPLQFWKEQHHNLPKLAQISAQNLTAMASTTFAEKLYRKCSGILDGPNSRLEKRDMELYLLGHAIAPKIDRELFDDDLQPNLFTAPTPMGPVPFPDFQDTMDPFVPLEEEEKFVIPQMEREVKEEPVDMDAIVQPHIAQPSIPQPSRPVIYHPLGPSTSGSAPSHGLSHPTGSVPRAMTYPQNPNHHQKTNVYFNNKPSHPPPAKRHNSKMAPPAPHIPPIRPQNPKPNSNPNPNNNPNPNPLDPRPIFFMDHRL